MTDTLQQDPIASSSELGFLACIQPDLAAIEALLQSEIRSDVRAAYAISGHTLSAGGKRLRPALVALSARAVNNAYPASTIHASASAAELIHMASLIHDDVVDGAEERRGRPTANAAFGNQISVLVGDYLLAKSIYLAAREGNIDVIRVFSGVTVGLSEGEVLQITARGDADTTLDTYLQIIQKKTAGFIAGCCEVGGMLAEGSPDIVHALVEYGHNLGLAFQIADDLLDYVGDPSVTGKALDGDLREGKVTLPLLLAIQDSDEPTQRMLRAVVEDPESLDETQYAGIHRAIAACDGYRRTATIAGEYAEKAKSALESLPETIYSVALRSLADYTVSRRR